METILLEEMTWPLVEKSLQEGYNKVIVPIGSIEQHGHHLPLGTDSYMGDLLGREIAKKLGKTLVAPTIKTGCSVHHMDFPGTVSISTDTLMKLIKDVCESLDRHGFETIILIPIHGGNFAPVLTVTQDIAPQLKANLIAIGDLRGLISKMKEGAKISGIPVDAVGGHAGAGETSLILAYKPQLVRLDSMKSGYIGSFTNKYVREGFKALTETGVLGEPKYASKEAGERITELILEMYVEKIKNELGGY